MIARPDAPAGVLFTGPEDGDMRRDAAARRRVSTRHSVPAEWATVSQVHGNQVRLVDAPGLAGEGDALVTTRPGLGVAVFTADCLGVVLVGDGGVGVAHAGWRGLAAGVLEATVETMTEAGIDPRHGSVGPGIGPCCFEVGDEVAERFPDDRAETTWGARSVDLRAAARRRLGGIPVEVDARCTACQGGPSHRHTGTSARMAAIGWLR
ncbi:MAG TPA: polyphenol oxidase family protein [Acidimicrobiia bacterium]|nr:polyphenol oxidase family protein [Acidimicrobiia bacterium]